MDSEEGGRCPCCGKELIGNGRAAQMLGVTKARVIQLIKSGMIVGQPFTAGTRTIYLIDAGSVRARIEALKKARARGD